MRASRTIKQILILAVTLSGLVACGADMDELDAYIVKIKAKPGSGIDDLPDPNLYEAFQYVADKDGIRSPFRPDTPQVAGGSNRIRPVRDRSREFLESFPLDTLVVVGENTAPDDPDQQVVVGAGAHINIPSESGAAYVIGADSMGLPEMRTGQENDFERASNYGLQMMSGKGAEAAETLKIKVAGRTATLVNGAETSAAGLEQMLKSCAEWIGDNPDDVSVKANTDFIDAAMPAAELLGLMNAKARGAPLSTRSIHANMRRGDLTKLTFDEETEAIEDEPPVDSGSLLGEPDGDQAGAGDDDNTGHLGDNDDEDDDDDNQE